MSTKPKSIALIALACTAMAAACRPVHANAGIAPTAAAHADSLRIRHDIAWLSSDERDGRGTGTAGNDSAASYIARRYRDLKLQPVAVDSSGRRDFLQRFIARPAARAHTSAAIALPTQNVVALLPGTDPTLRNEYVIIGAHFDHLGRDATFSTDPEMKDAIRNGADDNASGTAGVLELARIFSQHPTRRSIVFVNFSGEEYGLLGSSWFVKHAPIDLQKVQAMVNFDMIGRLKNERLIVYGVATAVGMRAIVDSAAAGLGFQLAAQGDGSGPSDHASFYEANIPVLHFFTDLHDDYHRASDDIERINAGGEARVVTMAERTVRMLADRSDRLAFVRAAAAPATMSSREGSNTYLGSVPDMAAADVPGLRLSGVREGSPAAKGGLKAGDLIVEFGGKPVTDLYTYTDALYAHKPGETVKIVVVRGTERLTLTVTLGKRGE